MADIDAVLVDNFKESLRQANRYLVLGLFSSAFLCALSLDPQAFKDSGSLSLPGGIPPVPVRYAQLALALVYWVSPFLADFSVARAQRIATQLQKSNLELLKAAVTFPCVATTRVHGPRWLVTLGPPVFVSVAGWMNGFFSFNGRGLMLFGISVVPYVTLFALRLRRSFGGLEPDAFGD